MIWPSREPNSHSSVFVLEISELNAYVRIYTSNVHSLWSSWSNYWDTTNNHCDRSWGDCAMSISGFSQVSYIFPDSVFIFGDCGWYVLWIIRIPADDQNTFTGWSSSIACYSKNEWISLVFVQNIYPSIHTYHHLKMGSQPLFPILLTHNQEVRSSIHSSKMRVQ